MTKKDLHKKLLEEIDKTGFPLELRVTKFLIDRDYHVANNLYYVDLDEEKSREIDIRALTNYEFISKENYLFLVRHCFLIECKKSKNKPWVIFTSPETGYEMDLPDLHCEGFPEEIAWYSDQIIDELAKIHPFKGIKRLGRSYFEAFKGKESGETILKSIASSVKAALMTEKEEFAAGNHNICFYYPMVIFEGNLFEAYLDKGRINIEESDLIFISFFYESIQYYSSNFIIPIVKENKLEELLKSFNEVLNFFGKKAEENLNWFSIK